MEQPGILGSQGFETEGALTRVVLAYKSVNPYETWRRFSGSVAVTQRRTLKNVSINRLTRQRPRQQ